MYHYYLDNICYQIERKLKRELEQTSETFSLMHGEVLKQVMKPDRETKEIREQTKVYFKTKLNYDQNTMSNHSIKVEGNSTYNIVNLIYKEFTNSTTKILEAQKEFTTLKRDLTTLRTVNYSTTRMRFETLRNLLDIEILVLKVTDTLNTMRQHIALCCDALCLYV